MIRAQSIIQCTQRGPPKSEVKPKRGPLCKIGRGDVYFQKKKEIYVLKQTSSVREDGAKQLNLQI